MGSKDNTYNPNGQRRSQGLRVDTRSTVKAWTTSGTLGDHQFSRRMSLPPSPPITPPCHRLSPLTGTMAPEQLLTALPMCSSPPAATHVTRRQSLVGGRSVRRKPVPHLQIEDDFDVVDDPLWDGRVAPLSTAVATLAPASINESSSLLPAGLAEAFKLCARPKSALSTISTDDDVASFASTASTMATSSTAPSSVISSHCSSVFPSRSALDKEKPATLRPFALLHKRGKRTSACLSMLVSTDVQPLRSCEGTNNVAAAEDLLLDMWMDVMTATGDEATRASAALVDRPQHESWRSTSFTPDRDIDFTAESSADTSSHSIISRTSQSTLSSEFASADASSSATGSFVDAPSRPHSAMSSRSTTTEASRPALQGSLGDITEMPTPDANATPLLAENSEALWTRHSVTDPEVATSLFNSFSWQAPVAACPDHVTKSTSVKLPVEANAGKVDTPEKQSNRRLSSGAPPPPRPVKSPRRASASAAPAQSVAISN
ncbi:hypothetical protein OIO90_003970 [Microbotryomycetes sp. JL221]|nr:hypothetical protein OIO90_003970 [Microbotryomycetes sp. JL221]